MGAICPSFRPSVLPSFRPSVRPSVLPSIRPSRFVSGAEHKNRERYLNQTWYIDRSSGELVPFDSLGFFYFIFLGIWDFFGGFFFGGIFYSLGFFGDFLGIWDILGFFFFNFLKVPFDSLGFLIFFFYLIFLNFFIFSRSRSPAGDMSISCLFSIVWHFLQALQ